jgi:hypothetical protein
MKGAKTLSEASDPIPLSLHWTKVQLCLAFICFGDKSIALQPVSAKDIKDVNMAGGIGVSTLRAAT